MDKVPLNGCDPGETSDGTLRVKGRHIDVATTKNVVMLRVKVDSHAAKQAAEEITKMLDGVHGMQGNIVGKIKQVLKDQKTGEIEYVILVPSDSKTPLPLRWSQFEERNEQLHLNMKQEDLKTVLNAPNTKDMSPDIQEHMNQIERVRSQPKAGYSQGSATSSPAAGGENGESETSRGGASGPQTLPQGQAPGLEGDHPSSKR